MFYGPECSLSWWLFCESLKRMCVPLPLAEVVHKCQLQPVDWWRCCVELCPYWYSVCWMNDAARVWIFLFIIMCVRFIDITVYSRRLFFVYSWIAFYYMTIIHFIHSTVEVLDCFQFLAISNKAKKTLILWSLCGYRQSFLLGIVLGVELVCHWIGLRSSLVDIANYFQKKRKIIWARYENTIFSCQYLVFSFFFDFSHVTAIQE